MHVQVNTVTRTGLLKIRKWPSPEDLGESLSLCSHPPWMVAQGREALGGSVCGYVAFLVEAIGGEIISYKN